ncbi:MAG TPA: sulfotransferase [Anaerolineae bacterium]|nr:sulfotransferase [Anaerolineae bacterium]
MPHSAGNLFTLPLGARALNTIGRSLEKIGLSPVNLDPEAICVAAQRKTGLSDFGGPIFCQRLSEGLQAILSSPASHLSLLGQISVRLELVRHAEIRLRAVHYHQQYPEISQMRWERPVFITGLPRTGSTLLHKLLCQDPAARAPYFWELLMPAPLAPADTTANDPRIRLAQTRLRQVRSLTSKYDHIHPLDALAPEECFFMMMAPNIVSRAYVPNYVKQLHNRGMEIDYQWYFEQLQVMQWYNGRGRFVSKTPFHLFGLAELLEIFPDAAFIQTHRRLNEAIPSWLSLSSVNHMLHEKQLAREDVTRYWLFIWGETLERAMAVRRQTDSSRFYDLHYTDLIADPIASVQAIYRHFGYNLTSEAESKMRRWLAGDRKKRPSTPHHYTMAQFGLTRQKVADHFFAYMTQFNVTI